MQAYAWGAQRKFWPVTETLAIYIDYNAILVYLLYFFILFSDFQIDSRFHLV